MSYNIKYLGKMIDFILFCIVMACLSVQFNSYENLKKKKFIIWPSWNITIFCFWALSNVQNANVSAESIVQRSVSSDAHTVYLCGAYTSYAE